MKCIAILCLLSICHYVSSQTTEKEASAEMDVGAMDSYEFDNENADVRTSSEMTKHMRRRHKQKMHATTGKAKATSRRPKSTTEQPSPFFDPIDNVENMLGLEEVEFEQPESRRR